MKNTKRSLKVVVSFILAISLFISITSVSSISLFAATTTDIFVFNEISEEDCLTDTAYDILTPVKIIQFINILKREVNIYRKV